MGIVVSKSITGAFSSNSRLDVREVKTESVRALSRYFYRWKYGKQRENVIFRKRLAFDMQFYLIVVSIFLKKWLKDHEIAPANCYKEGFD